MTPPLDQLQVAMVQATFLLDDRQANLSKVEVLSRQAVDQGANLIAFPEAVITGSIRHLGADVDLHAHAVSIPGPETDQLSALAKGLSAAISIGTFESGYDRHLYNSCIIATPDGTIHTARKSFPAPGEKGRTAPGDLSPVVDIFGWKIGFCICYDLYFPEVARLLALKGAQAMVIPTGGTGIPQHLVDPTWWKAPFNRSEFMHYCPARALENGMYILVPVAADAGGGSLAVDPTGSQIASTDGHEGIVPVILRRDLLERQKSPFITEVRPDLYEQLAAAAREYQARNKP